jgi:hypothetical protein
MWLISATCTNTVSWDMHMSRVYKDWSFEEISVKLRETICSNCIVTCIARQRTGKHLATEYTHATIELRMLLLVARQQSERQSASEITIMYLFFCGSVPWPLLCNSSVNKLSTMVRPFSVGSVQRVLSWRQLEWLKQTRVEAGSNASTVILRVVGGDEKGSLKSETVTEVASPKGLGPQKDCAGKGQRHIQKTDPSSRQRGRPTESRT